MRFQLYLNGAWVEKRANIMATSNSVKDETLDTASIEIMFDEREDAYPARTLARLDEYKADGSNDSEYYFVATDNVTIQSLDPRGYKHKLTLVQTTRHLSHFTLPNMVIRQPRESVARTYFFNENCLNPMYYQARTRGTDGVCTFANFTTPYTSLTSTGPSPYALNSDPTTTHSPYWGECVPLSVHSHVEKARITLYWDAMVCSYNSTSQTATATLTRLNRALARPSWLNAYLVIYKTETNVNRLLTDNAMTDKIVLVKKSIDDVTWTEEGGYYDLTDAEMAKINAYSSGYLMCEISSELGTGAPDVFWVTVGSTKTAISSPYDKLFTDVSEYADNGIQSVWSRLSLELTYRSASLYDTLQKILDRQQLRHSKSSNAPLFSLPTSGDDFNVLTKTPSPEFSFSNTTVFDAVSQVLETIDALPRFDCDDDGNLSLTLDYYATTGGNVASATKFTGYVQASSEQKRDNGIVANYQNAERLFYFPTKPLNGVPCYARCRVKSYGIPQYTDFSLSVDKPIKYIDHLWVKCSMRYNVAVPTDDDPTIFSYLQVENIPVAVDLASFIFDEGTYSSSLAQGADYDNYYNHNVRMQQNCLRFKQGSKDISVGNKATNQWNQQYNTLWNCIKICRDRYMGQYGTNYTGFQRSGVDLNNPTAIIKFPDENSFREIYFACEYGSDTNGRLEVQSVYPKEEGSYYASTSGSSPDLGKLGLNMLGVSMMNGEPTMNCGQVISKWENRIKIGAVYPKGDDLWIATKASYNLMGKNSDGDIINGTIEFTKNFNGLSKRVAIDQRKRLYNIDRSIAELCEGNVIEYVYFEMLPRTKTPTDANGDCPFDENAIGQIIMKAFTDDPSQYKEVTYGNLSCVGGTSGVYFPLSVYGAGNCLCFEGKFDDPISAGIQMTASQDGTTYWWASDSWSPVVNNYYYYGSDVKYPDEEGYADYFSIAYCANNGALVSFTDQFPSIYMTAHTTMGKLANLYFRKEPNEIFGLNFELAFLSKNCTAGEQVFFGKRFFDAWDEKKGLKGRNLRFFWDGEAYRPTEHKAKGFLVSLSVSHVAVNGYHYLNLTSDYIATANRTINCSSFAIADEDGEMLIFGNCSFSVAMRKGVRVTLPRLHFFARNKRI